jgi:hypothetical protein
MGELDLIKVCFTPTPFDDGLAYARNTVLLTWLPLAVAGVVLRYTTVVHATMRGAGALRMLAQLAIAIQVAAVALPLLWMVVLLGDLSFNGKVTLAEAFLLIGMGSSLLLPAVAISAPAIIAWHRVLVDLASHRGETRMLV